MDVQYEILVAFITSVFILAISPGPDNLFVLMQSMVNGVKQGFAVVLGLMTGCIIHTTLVAFGVSVLIKESDILFLIIKIFGAAYLFFLAFKVYRGSASIELSEKEMPKKSFITLFRQGFLMNVLNPKVSIFFLAFFPGFLFSNTISEFIQFYILGFFFILISFIVFGLIALLAGRISSFIKTNSRVGVILKWTQVTVFIGIGIFILLSEK